MGRPMSNTQSPACEINPAHHRRAKLAFLSVLNMLIDWSSLCLYATLIAAALSCQGEDGRRLGGGRHTPLRGLGGMQHFEGIAGSDDIQPRVIATALEARPDRWSPGEIERPYRERAHARMPPPELDRLRRIEREMPRAGAIGDATARARGGNAVRQDRRGYIIVGLP